jgi:hypothetical protein
VPWFESAGGFSGRILSTPGWFGSTGGPGVEEESMSGQELTHMVGVMVSFVLLLGLLGFFCVLLNLRDRRRARVLHAVLDQIGTPDLRGRFTVQVRCGLLSPGAAVAIELLACSRNEIWELMARLSQHLSPRVRLEVTGPTDHCFLATFTARTTSRPELRPRLATG